MIPVVNRSFSYLWAPAVTEGCFHRIAVCVCVCVGVGVGVVTVKLCNCCDLTHKLQQYVYEPVQVLSQPAR